MRRIILVFTVAALMAAMLMVSAFPALAAPPANKPGQYTCYNYFPSFEVHRNVPQGQTALYDECYPNPR
jgi:hypothetical protein